MKTISCRTIISSLLERLQITLIILILGIGAVVAHAAEVKLTAADAAAGDFFGYSASVSGDYAIVGAPQNDDDGTDSGSAYIFKYDGSSWNQQQKLTASDAGVSSHCFGESVSISGDYAIVGAFRRPGGAVYMFARNGETWTEQAKFPKSDGYFAQSVSISGNYAIAGAFAVNSNTGTAYIFVRSGENWTQQAQLTADDAAAGDRFGCSVSISGDYATVGAKTNDDNGTDSGSAYIFKRDGSSWNQQAKLTASDAAAGNDFGISVSISGDYAIVAARFAIVNQNDAGSAYIFKRDVSSWSQQAKLTASDAAAGDHFGQSVSISGDYAIVGAHANDDSGSESGSAYSFLRSGSSWSQKAKITASDAAAVDRFGISVSISGDYAIVGAREDDHAGGTDAGSAYIFEVEVKPNPATVDLDPDTLNLNSKGKWITCYIELEEGYDVADIDISSVLLEDTIPAESSPVEIGDNDEDGISDLMIKFDRQELIVYLGDTTGDVTLTVIGELMDDTSFEGSDTITVISKGGKGKSAPALFTFSLEQNFPNPFNPETWIPYQLKEPAEVVIRIYDAKGGLVRTLDLGQHAAGFYLGRTRAAYWNGHNDAGEKVASGIYFYQIKAGDFSAARKMIIVK